MTRKLTANRDQERAGLRVLVERAYKIDSALSASQRGTELEREARKLLFEAICKLQNAEQALRRDDARWVQATLADELARRSAIYTNWAEGAPICQDDYEWVTMTGVYYDDRAAFQKSAPKEKEKSSEN